MDPTTPDSRAALLVSHIAEATGLDKALITEVERRISAQDSVSLAPVLAKPRGLLSCWCLGR